MSTTNEQQTAQNLTGTTATNVKPIYYQPQYVHSQPQFVHSHLVQSAVQPVVQQVVQQQPVAQQPVTTLVQSGVRQSVKGESRIEYVPYERVEIEYEPVVHTDYVPREKKVTDYYAVEYQTEYIPQVYHDKYIEYIPQERVQERVEYQTVERQVVHQPVVQQQQVQQTVQVVQQPVQYVQQPVQQVQYVQQPVQVQYVQQPVAVTGSRIVQSPTRYVQPSSVVRASGFGTLGQPLTYSYIAQPGVSQGFAQFPTSTQQPASNEEQQN